ncbi:MAG: ABC transporter ATP-binding protein [Deltaproteobacteria bacterium]|nr:ABC transporter ATP-binding protein [Deltaproteobacteria bacterium]
MLKVDSIHKSFMGIRALNGVDLEVEEGQILGIIGPNGAGKTTLFNVITGLIRQDFGHIYLEGKDISRAPIYSRVRLGMARTFQNLAIFRDMSVLENVMSGGHQHINSGLLDCILDSRKKRQEERRLVLDARALLRLFGLEDKADQDAINLSYGEQRKVEIARAVATRPKVLFLDEPASGMNPRETEELDSLIKRISEDMKLTIVLIEHDMNLVMDICEKVVVMFEGSVLTSGLPLEVRNDQRVIDAYLGEDIV